MTPAEAIETVGRMADKADNLLHAAKLPVPDSIHVTGMKAGLEEIHQALQEAYVALGGRP